MFNNETLQKILLNYLYRSAAHPSPDELNILAENTSRLSNLFTRDRANFRTEYLKDKNLRKAYILYFLPSNLYKVHIPLRELSLHPANIFMTDRLRILDLGSGPGTAILGISEYFHQSGYKPFLDFYAIDNISENLRDAEALFNLFRNECSVEGSIKTFKSCIEKVKNLPVGPFDIIILSNILSEVAHNEPDRIAKRGAIVKRFIEDFLNDSGSCIVIEPALRNTSREMLEVRDKLLKEGFHIYSPCLINKDCPALENPKDWCHEDIPWNPPELIKSIDALTGLRKDSIKYSYLVIRKDTLSLTDIHGEHSFRVVSEPLISKGKIEFYVCGSIGRRLIVRLDKNRSGLNKAFEGMKRGNIVILKGFINEGNRLKVSIETDIQILKRHCLN